LVGVLGVPRLRREEQALRLREVPLAALGLSCTHFDP
jgi:hypothetical protein